VYASLLLAAVACVGAGETGGRGRLAACWDFEAGDGDVTPDASGNGHDGALRAVESGAAPERTPGMVGRAMRFNAAQGCDIVVENHPRLNPSDGLTVCAWIKHEGPFGPAAEIVGKKGLAKAIVNGWRFWVARSGALCLEVGDGEAVSRVATERGEIRSGLWAHAAGTFAPGRVRLYVNCRLVVDREVPAQRIAPSPNRLVIGNFAGRRNAMPFNGFIDEVNVSSAALDADAVFLLAKPDKLRQ